MHNYVFPQFYSPWLATRFPNAIKEQSATCQDCLMARPVTQRGPTRDPGLFSKNLKCCTYFPYLPNFSLGALSESHLNHVANQGVLLPVGLYPSQDYLERKARLGVEGFGRAQELLCPFFDVALNACGIWQYRPGVCTSYFCQSDYGAQGLQLWSEIERYLNQFEWQLARKVFFDLGLGDNELVYGRGAISADTDPEERAYFIEAAWGQFSKNKFEFYKQCTLTALAYSESQITSLLDRDILTLEASINSKIKALSSK